MLVDLIGEGDPLIAMTRLTHRILETIELDDDAVRITAAAYSLGLGSAGRTHLQRLTDFGIEYGYEARQARRLSDEGLRELARLITTNWVVHAVPSVEVFVVQISDRSFAVQVNTRRQWYIDMRALVIEAQDGHGRRYPLEPPPVIVTHESSDDGHPRDTSTTLEKFIRLPALAPGDEHRLRVNWPGEIWPRFSVSTMGPLEEATLVTGQTVGNTCLLTVQRDRAAAATAPDQSAPA